MAVSKQKHIHVAPEHLLWGWCSKALIVINLLPDEDAPLQKQTMLLKDPHGFHETAYHKIPSWLNTSPGANPLQKKDYSFTKNFLHWKKIQPERGWIHDSFPRASTCSTLPWISLVSSEANSPLTIVCICKSYWTWLQISSGLPEVAVPVASEFLAPLFLRFPGLTLLLLVHFLMDEGCTWN